MAEGKDVEVTSLPQFEIDIQDLSSIDTMIRFNPNRDVVEDRPRQKEYPRQEMGMVLNKVLIIFYKLSSLENYEHIIFYFEYPNLSHFLRVGIVIFIMYFDPAYMLSYILGLVIFIFCIWNQSW